MNNGLQTVRIKKIVKWSYWSETRTMQISTMHAVGGEDKLCGFCTQVDS